MTEPAFRAISPADFFYSNRDIAGFDNPTRALYTAFREIIENSLDACEDGGYLPSVFVHLQAESHENIYSLSVIDNGVGVPKRHIEPAFGKILYGSKYKHRQARGRFGLGGKMAYLYGQITTHQPLRIVSAVKEDPDRIETILRVDIKKNEPIVISRNKVQNTKGSHGLSVNFSLEGDWSRSRKAILDYLTQTALITPYATLSFIDPDGVLYFFPRTINKLPPPPQEVLPHPYGVDIEQVRRIIETTPEKKLTSFLTNQFHRVGNVTAKRFLEFAKFDPTRDPKSLEIDEVVTLVRALKNFNEFLPPDAKSLSPLGEELLRVGIKRLLNPEFIEVIQRPPSSYSGHPFIVEVGMAYGGPILTPGTRLFRFANRIPLIYDEYKDVSSKVINSIDWNRYKIKPGSPIAVFVDVVSTKIPFKTAGKEFIADRAELEREIKLGLLICARNLALHLSKQEKMVRDQQRLKIFDKWLPLIARDVTILAERKTPPNLTLVKARLSKLAPKIEEPSPSPSEEESIPTEPEPSDEPALETGEELETSETELPETTKPTEKKKKQASSTKGIPSPIQSSKDPLLSGTLLSNIVASGGKGLSSEELQDFASLMGIFDVESELNQLSKQRLIRQTSAKNKVFWHPTNLGIAVAEQLGFEESSKSPQKESTPSKKPSSKPKPSASKKKPQPTVKKEQKPKAKQQKPQKPKAKQPKLSKSKQKAKPSESKNKAKQSKPKTRTSKKTPIKQGGKSRRA